jgi:hypothetical protein
VARLVPAIHVFKLAPNQDMDAWHEVRHGE